MNTFLGCTIRSQSVGKFGGSLLAGARGILSPYDGRASVWTLTLPLHLRTLPAEPGVRGKRAIPKKDALGDAVWGRMHTDTCLKKSGRTEPCVNSVLVDGA